MRNPKNTWNTNLQNIKRMHWLHEQLVKIVSAMDISDILRSEYVLIVSAFDCYIHDVVLQGMSDMFSGNRTESKNFADFCIPMSTVKELLATSDAMLRESIYNVSVKKILSKDSYQSPKSVEFALSMVNMKNIWSKVGKLIGMSTEDVKTNLGLIILRRNKIAHEADIENLVSMKKSEIDRTDVEEVIVFLNNVVLAIDKISIEE